MMQQAVRRLLPGACLPQSQLASAFKAGEYSSSFSSVVVQQEDKQNQPSIPASIPSNVLQVANMFSRPSSSMPRSPVLGMPKSFAASPLLSTTRSMGLLAAHSRPALPSVKGLGSGLGQTRSFGTDGQLVGATYLLTTDLMFWIGLIGAVVFRRNLIVMLLATEIVMLACNMNFLFGAAYLNDMMGVIMSITITTIAACETAIGLALCVTYFHVRSATDVEALNFLK